MLLAKKTSLITIGLIGSLFAFAAPETADAKLFCSNDGKRFNEWKTAFKNEYRGKYKASTLAKLDGVKYDTSVIKLDRNNKKSFKGTS